MADLNGPERINEAALKELEKRLSKLEPQLVKSVISWLEKFRTTSGNIVRTQSNSDRVAAFQKAMIKFLQKSGYYEMVSLYVKNFDFISASEKAVHLELNGIKLDNKFVNVYRNLAVKKVIDDMTKTGLKKSLINPLRNELFIAVNQGSSLRDVITSISGQLATTEQRAGIVRKLSIQSSRDALLQYDGVVNEAVRKQFKMPYVFYVGSLVKDSRAQCERWVNYDKEGKIGVIAFEDLESEIMWAEDNGSGMIPNTTPENFCQNRGGFNCRHQAYPIRMPKKSAQ